MTSGTERQILAHNNYGERLGCTGFTANSKPQEPGLTPAFKLPGIPGL